MIKNVTQKDPSPSNNSNSVESNERLGSATTQKVEKSTSRQVSPTQASADSVSKTFTDNCGENSLEAGFFYKLRNFFEPFTASQPYQRNSEGHFVNVTTKEMEKFEEEKANYRQAHREEYLEIIWSGLEEMMTKLGNPNAYHVSPILKPSEDEIGKMQNMYCKLLTIDLSSPHAQNISQGLERILLIKNSHIKPITENSYLGAYLSASNNSNTLGQIQSIKSKLEYCFGYSLSFKSKYSSTIFSMLENIQRVENTHTSEYLHHIEDIIDLTLLLGKGNWYRNTNFYSATTITDQEKKMRDLSIYHHQQYESSIAPHMTTLLDVNEALSEKTLNTLRKLSPIVKQALQELNPLKDMFPKG